MSAKVIDFFAEASKRNSPVREVPPSATTPLTELQTRAYIVLDLISNEIRTGEARPTCFFLMYGKPWDENPSEMLWHYAGLGMTPGLLQQGADKIIADMVRRKK